MNLSFFIILFTLATAVASKSPLTVKQEARKYSTSLVQELISIISKAGSIWNSPPSATRIDATKVKVSEMKTDKGKSVATNSVNCISAEFCSKKKVTCTRICNKARRVRANHVHDKCFLKCKKCIPTC
ncbi:hypothetical protein LUZ60_016602 [Juncus effusus]|nr:hypothetical protein LUZ60_016602 [Juncus effusus]